MRPAWDEYFMGFARAAAARATCDRKHVGAVIVVGGKPTRRPFGVSGGQVAATGYNGSVRGLPHCDEAGHDMEGGHCVRTIHAEMNALAQAARRGVRVDGATIYTTASPCWDCLRVLVNAGIVRFVYAEDYRSEEHAARIRAVVGAGIGVSVERLGFDWFKGDIVTILLSPPRADAEAYAKGAEAAMEVLAPPPPPPPLCETRERLWDLGDGAMARITLPDALTPRQVSRLRRYADCLAEEAAIARGDKDAAE